MDLSSCAQAPTRGEGSLLPAYNRVLSRDSQDRVSSAIPFGNRVWLAPSPMPACNPHALLRNHRATHNIERAPGTGRVLEFAQVAVLLLTRVYIVLWQRVERREP